ncbi:hypothetical protein ABK040_002178 [Willaertia magna]
MNNNDSPRTPRKRTSSNFDEQNPFRQYNEYFSFSTKKRSNLSKKVKKQARKFLLKLKHILKYSFTKKPYLAAIHSLLSLPLSLGYVTVLFLGLTIGTITYPIYLGVFILGFMSFLLRCFISIEIILARNLFCCKHKLPLPKFQYKILDIFNYSSSSILNSSITASEAVVSSNLLGNNNERDAEDDFNIRAQRQPVNISSMIPSKENRLVSFPSNDISLKSNGRKPQSMGSTEGVEFMKTPPTAGAFLTSYSPLKLVGPGNSNVAAMDDTFQHYDSGSDSEDSIHSPTSQTYYYQNYGTMLGRSLDATYVSNRVNVLARNNTSMKNDEIETTVAESEVNSPCEIEKEKSFWGIKGIYRLFYKYTFCKEIGLSVLYFVMKVPISFVTFTCTAALLIYLTMAVAAPIVHIVCVADAALSTNGFCSVVMDGKGIDGPFIFFKWYFWFFNSIYGNLLVSITAVLLLPFVIYFLRVLSRPSRQTLLLIK